MKRAVYREPKPHSLKRLIVLRLFFITALVFLLVEGIILERSHRALNKSLELALQARAEALLTLSEVESDGQVEFDFADEVMRDYGGAHASAFFLIRRFPDGTELERSDSLGSEIMNVPPSSTQIAAGKPYFWNSTLRGTKVRCIALRAYPRAEDEREQGEDTAPGRVELLLMVAQVRENTDVAFWGIVKRVSLALGLGLLFILAASWLVINRSLRPLAEMEQEVQGLSATNLTPVPVPAVREIATVAEALNLLIKRLRASFERERQFTADVAHELRTPIAELRTLSEVALKWQQEVPDDVRQNYEDMLASARQMQSLVNALLTLARCDSGALSVQQEVVDLASIVGDAWRQFDETIKAKNLRLACDIPSTITLVTDKELLQSMILNLVANAVEYTPSGGKIECQARIQQGEFSFTLANSTEGLTPEDLPHLFERFWRKDAARTRTDLHSGLGLSLVQSLAQVLGFHLNARLADHTMLTITLSITLSKKV